MMLRESKKKARKKNPLRVLRVVMGGGRPARGLRRRKGDGQTGAHQREDAGQRNTDGGQLGTMRVLSLDGRVVLRNVLGEMVGGA